MDSYLSLLSLMTVNLFLSSDNALAIGLACSRLNASYRQKAILYGSISAVSLQIAFACLISFLLDVPYLKLAGGVLLCWIALKLLCPESTPANTFSQPVGLYAAIKTITAANTVMSFDNVVAAASIANGNKSILALGLLLSFPIIMWGSKFVLTLLDKYPAAIWLAAAFLGWTAGGIVFEDTAACCFFSAYNISNTTVASCLSMLVVTFGFLKYYLEKNSADIS